MRRRVPKNYVDPLGEFPAIARRYPPGDRRAAWMPCLIGTAVLQAADLQERLREWTTL